MFKRLQLALNDDLLGHEAARRVGALKDDCYFFTPAFSIPRNEWQPLMNPFHFFIIRSIAEERGLHWNPNQARKDFLKAIIEKF